MLVQGPDVTRRDHFQRWSQLQHERDARAHIIFCLYLLAAVLAHLASVFRNGNAFGGGSMVPVSDVLKGTMRL